MPAAITEKELDDRLERFTQRGEGDQCWIWTGKRNNNGYGIVAYRWYPPQKRMVLAHRLSYERKHGPIPEGLCICHHCDNRLCVNPSHLFLGTRLDNNRDRMMKGRSTRLIGVAHHQAKLSEQDVLTIRARYANGGVYQRELAAEYGVHQTNIGFIVRGVRWKQVVARTILVVGFLILPGQLRPSLVSADSGGFEAQVSAYCDQGTMADGNWTYAGAAAGASWLPFGSRVWVAGVGVVTIEDRGIEGLFTVDVFTWSCDRAWAWGRQWVPMEVLRWGWGS